jgi:hypothetical protein
MDTLNGIDFEQTVTACAITERSIFIKWLRTIAEILGRAKLRYKSITAREEQGNNIALLSKDIVTTARLRLNRDGGQELIFLRIVRVGTR